MAEIGGAVRRRVPARRRRAAYHFWRGHPGETMFFPMEALHVEGVPAADGLGMFNVATSKPAREGHL